MDCIVHGVAKSQAQLSEFHFKQNQNPLAKAQNTGKEFLQSTLCAFPMSSQFSLKEL